MKLSWLFRTMKDDIRTFLKSENGRYVDAVILVLIPVIMLTVPIPFLNLFLCFLLVMAYTWLQDGIKEGLGFEKPQNLLVLVLRSLVLAIVIVALVFILLPLITRMTGVHHDLGFFDAVRGDLAIYISALGTGWLVGGFIEEIVFRSFMMQKIMRLSRHSLVGKIAAVILPAAFFGFLHQYQGITGQILTGLIGVILAIIFLWNQGKIWQNILVHGFINTITITMIYLNLDKSFY